MIPALEAQINVPSVVELKGLSMEMLEMNDRRDAVKKMTVLCSQEEE